MNTDNDTHRDEKVVVKQESLDVETSTSSKNGFSKVSENANENQEKGEKRSCESDDTVGSLTKRTKHDDPRIGSPVEAETEHSEKTADEDLHLYGAESSQSEVRVYPTPEETLRSENLPENIEKIMNFVYNWDPQSLKRNDELIITNLRRKLKDMSNILQYPSDEIYKVVNVPILLIKLYGDLRKTIQNIDFRTNPASYAVLLKSRHDEGENFEMTCFTIRKVSEESNLKFGQLVELRTRTRKSPNSLESTLSPRYYYGYISNAIIREIDINSPNENNYWRFYSNEDMNSRSYVIEEVVVRTRFTDEFYKRNDFLLVIRGLKNIHYFILQSKILYGISTAADHKNSEFSNQLINPNFTVPPSGLLINVNTEKYSSLQLDAIQKSIDLIAGGRSSYFGCLKSSKKFLTLSVVVETINQLLLFMKRNELQRRKILITAANNDDLSLLIEMVRRVTPKIFCFGSEDTQKRIDSESKKLLDNLLRNQEKVVQQNPGVLSEESKLKDYKQCQVFFNTGKGQLTPSALLEKDNCVVHTVRKLLERSDVVAGPIETICNDVTFYLTFNSKKGSRIVCCFVEEATSIHLEPEILCLRCFGVEKYILCSSSTAEDDVNSDYLNRSLFSRLYRCGRTLTGSSSIVDFDRHS